MRQVPLVTVLVAVSNGERYLNTALASVLRQTLTDLELVVVDDGSTDTTPEILAGIGDRRLHVLRNDTRLGLAASLNRGLEEARGRYVARLDADDVALPNRLALQVERVRSEPLAVLGSAVLDLEEPGGPGQLHLMPESPAAVRWAALFSSPFFHPTALVDRDALERHGLRYDAEFLESEDYDLWTRLLAHEEGANLPAPLVLYRVHPEQASRRRRDIQRLFQQRVALREIARVAPELDAQRAELAWRVGAGEGVDRSVLHDAVEAFTELLTTFERSLRPTHSRSGREVRANAARALARAASAAEGRARISALAAAGLVDPTLPVHAVRRRVRRRTAERAATHAAVRWLHELEAPPGKASLRVAAVFPEPTPYRAPLLDQIAALDEVVLTVVYTAESVAGRTWRVELRHRAVFLRGLRVPGAHRLVHHDYPLTLGIRRALVDAAPDVVVVSGWSTFAAQAAIAWCRLKNVPYVLVVESHDEGPRAGWRRRVKGAVVPPIVASASGVLVTGTLARRSMIARGAPPERVHLFANTIDVEAFGERADRLVGRRAELRTELGAGPDDVVVLSVGRLAPEKGHDDLIRAVATADDSRLLLVLVGDGPERERLAVRAQMLGVRLVLAGDRAWERIVEVYAAADVLALLSTREPWAVVVNEAAASGLPLVLSDRVGAAHDLLRDGENGVLVAAGDVGAAAAALRRLSADSDLRRAYGARSRVLAANWGYAPSVAGFVDAVTEAVADHGER